MPTTNFDICVMAIRATDSPNRGDAERDFTERYQLMVATTGSVMAETLANAEARYWLHQIEPEGAAYLRPFLN